jgi:hypothetical protein
VRTLKEGERERSTHTFEHILFFSITLVDTSMDPACQKNLTGCLASMGLKLCDVDKDICLQHGLCITPIVPAPLSLCVCYPCYYGTTCENEVFSRNLWIAGEPSEKPEMITATKVLLLIFTVIQIINCLLCLQTYFSSRKIRITNIGVYLIFNSLISLLISLEELVTAILVWFIAQLPESYWHIQCLIDQKFMLLSLTYIWGWSVLFIGLERMLVECCDYSLFASRKRSLIISTLIFIICPLTTIPGIFTLKELPIDKLSPQANNLLIPYSCINYTPLGYTIFKVISSIHTYVTLVGYMVLCLIALIHLRRHRQRIAPQYTTRQNIRFVLHKHRDFFLPLIVDVVTAIPLIVINEMMTCSGASELDSLPYLLLVFGSIFGVIPTSFLFFFYIYPANVYMVAFWNNSIVGRCLIKLKNIIITIGQRLKNTRLVPARLRQQPQVEAVNFEHEARESRV